MYMYAIFENRFGHVSSYYKPYYFKANINILIKVSSECSVVSNVKSLSTQKTNDTFILKKWSY